MRIALLIAIMMFALVSTMTVIGEEATVGKTLWSLYTDNGKNKMPKQSVAIYFGTEALLDICLSNNWDCTSISNGVVAYKKLFGGSLMVRALAVCMNSEDVGAGTSLERYCMKMSLDQGKMVDIKDMKINDYVGFLLTTHPLKGSALVLQCKEKIRQDAVGYAKRSLRNKGKTFVTKDGINPIEVEMTPVIEALNAPKLQGLEVALRNIGVDIQDIVRDPAGWMEVEKEKDAVFYGEKDAHPTYDGGIVLLLGAEGYKNWVKEYNDGK